jgi:hypothetical protein
MGYLITFLLNLIYWEFIYIGIPAIIVAVAAWQLWWKKLPDDEKEEYKRGHLFFGKRSNRTDGGGIISLFINIVFVIKVYVDGNWGVPFATWKFDYLVFSYLWALFWVLIIIGIPMLIGGSWWIFSQMKKEA